MKILIDQNISFRLINWIEGAFPNVLHVKSLGLGFSYKTPFALTGRIRSLAFDFSTNVQHLKAQLLEQKSSVRRLTLVAIMIKFLPIRA